MPPKPRFSKEEMINAAFEIAKKDGIRAVTARNVAAVLGCSARPIFTFFSSMEELQNEVREAAQQLLDDRLKIAENYYPSFKMRGIQLVKFSADEPELFKIIFMPAGKAESLDGLIHNYSLWFRNELEQAAGEYGIGAEQAERLFSHLWLQTFGLCVMCVNGMYTFNEKEVSDIFGETFAGELMFISRGSDEKAHVFPIEKSSVRAKQLIAEGSGFETGAMLR